MRRYLRCMEGRSRGEERDRERERTNKYICKNFKMKYNGRQINKHHNKMIWTCFNNEWKENHKKRYEHKNKRKMPKRKTVIKRGTTGQERCHCEPYPLLMQTQLQHSEPYSSNKALSNTKM
jgi:hypothetical protein